MRLIRREDGTLRTPLEVMTGSRPSRSFFLTNLADTTEVMTIDNIFARQLIGINKLLATLEHMHPHMDGLFTKQRKKQTKYHHSKTSVGAHLFSGRDFVLVSKPHDSGHKLKFR